MHVQLNFVWLYFNTGKQYDKKTSILNVDECVYGGCSCKLLEVSSAAVWRVRLETPKEMLGVLRAIRTGTLDYAIAARHI